MYQHDPQHTGQSEYVGPQTTENRFFDIVSAPHYLGCAQPVIGSNGMVYLAVRDNQDGSIIGRLYALNSDGITMWQFDLGGIPSTPAIGTDGTIYVQTAFGKVYAISPNGSEKWTFQCESGYPCGITIGPDGTIYVPAYPGLYALNPDGTKKWLYQEGYYLWPSTGYMWFREVAIGPNGTIYAVFPGVVGMVDCVAGSIHAIDPNGTLKWKSVPGGYNLGAPSVGQDGTIYVAGTYLYAYNPDNGELLWKKPICDANEYDYYHQTSVLAIASNGTIIASSYYANMRAFNPQGDILWSFSTNPGNPVLDKDNTIFVSCPIDPAAGEELTRIYWIDSISGTVKQSFDISKVLPATVDPLAIGGNGQLYVPFIFSDYTNWPLEKHTLKLCVIGFPIPTNQPPYQPTNISPTNGVAGVILTPILQSSPFSDPDSGDTHIASQWQVTKTSGDYSTLIFDSGIDTQNLTHITLQSLEENTTYYWHVRYRDNHNAWSEWSIETSFTTTAATGIISGKVTNSSTGNPIRGSTVSANEYVTITDLSGNYTLYVPPGTYSILVEAPKHMTQVRRGIVVSEGQTVEVNFSLNKSDFTFVHLTDVHIGTNETAEFIGSDYAGSTAAAIFNVACYDRFIGLIEGINELPQFIRPDFILITGDNVDWADRSNFDNFKKVLKEYNKLPVYVVPGNHDRFRHWWFTSFANWKWFKKGGELVDYIRERLELNNDHLSQYYSSIESPNFLKRPDGNKNCDILPGFNLLEPSDDTDLGLSQYNYSFEHNGYAFIGLDSGADTDLELKDLSDLGPEGGGLANLQMRALESHKEGWPKIVFLHHPIITGGIDIDTLGNIYEDASVVNNREDFIIYCIQKDVKLVLSGHTHESHVFNAMGEQLDNQVIQIGKEHDPLFVQTPSATKNDRGFQHGYRIIEVVGDEVKVRPYMVGPPDRFYIAAVCCGPAGLTVHDSQGRTVGWSGSSINVIPNSFYTGYYGPSNDQSLILYDLTGNYRFKVEGTGLEGDYTLTIFKRSGVQDEFKLAPHNLATNPTEMSGITCFVAENIPILPNSVHQFEVDWDVLSQGGKGVTVKIDSNGDGTFEQTIITGATFDHLVVGLINAPTDPVKINTSITASATFTDLRTSDTHTAVWNWGDGSTSEGSITESSGSGSVSGSHTYSAAGVYTITLTVTDQEGASGTSKFQYVVIYDPSAGFVTGGGWINSPVGAYTPDPSLTGKANFGFVSKYQKGATIPTGQTQFKFHVANMDFNSTSYQWLVIAGAKAQYKGSGTINGKGDYEFILTAIDGQVNGGGGIDKFRIKIMDKITGTIVYDNQMGAGDDDNPTTAIAGGNIVIHKDEDKSSPKDFRLLSSFPNPANPDIWIPYQLANDACVTIKIYDVSGKLVRTLDLGYKPAGFYTDKDKSAYWDGRNEIGEKVSSGIYFYTIQAGDFTATRKMVIQK